MCADGAVGGQALARGSGGTAGGVVVEHARGAREAEVPGRPAIDRIAIRSGRDLVLAPSQAGEPLNHFIQPHAERDVARAEGWTHVVSARGT